MNRLERGKAPARFLVLAQREQLKATRFFAQPERQRAHREFTFKAHHHISARRGVWYMTNGTCAFCQSPVDVEFAALAHCYRPARDTLAGDGTFYRDLYWWLAGNWANLFPCCVSCARERGTRFPLEDESNRARRQGDEHNETPLIIDPCGEDPDEHLLFLDDGRVIPRPHTSGKPSLKGKATIEVFGLNRTDLLERRAKNARELMALLQRAGRGIRAAKMATDEEATLRKIGKTLREDIGQFLSPEFPFTAMGRQIVGRWAAGLQLKEHELIFPRRSMDWWVEQAVGRLSRLSRKERTKAAIDYEHSDRRHDFVQRSRWVERIEIENFKGIEHLDIALVADDVSEGANWPWIVVLGENATGKTSVLEAIALALSGATYANSLELSASNFVRRLPRKGKTAQPKSGLVRIHFSKGSEPVEMNFQRHSPLFGHSTSQVPTGYSGVWGDAPFAKQES